MEMKIEAVKDQNEGKLMQLPNVLGVGIGEKDGKPVIKVFVAHKVPEASLRKNEIVPKKLGGYSTDVEELGAVTAQSS